MLLTGVAVTAVTLLSGCTIPTAETDAVQATLEVGVPPVVETTTAPEPPTHERFAAAFDELSATLAGTVGIAIGPVGADGSVEVAGEWASGPAWSTIKVPLAIAALNSSGGAEQADAVQSAITISDNAAAEQLWSALGSPEDAALAVEGVLQEFGDRTTTVPSTRARPEYSIFGQTDWSLSEQARFGSALACKPEAEPVYSLMGQISGDQSWGLGALADAHFKGGWGPGPTGGYLVRQLGVIDTPTGQLTVAIAAETAGSFTDGTALLSQVAGWISANPALLPIGGSC
ncbi:hypothetical protein [Tomitella biformata]|uniref:hypothetical protein n=1 Tax=Tomitella biformata TaxID=630403 RepID=UPI000462F55C|nr:hypothetical protein [Tomitella biformata]